MKKNQKAKPEKLALSRETLRLLADANLEGVGGGTETATCAGTNNTCRPTDCVLY